MMKIDILVKTKPLLEIVNIPLGRFFGHWYPGAGNRVI